MSDYNILHIVRWLGIGGSEKVVFDLITHRDKKRFKSLVCAFQGGEKEEDYRKKQIKFQIVKKQRSLDFIFLFKIINLIRKGKVDLVHCHEIPSTVYGGLAAKLSGVPIVITVHGRSAFIVKEGVKALQYAQRFGARIIAVSDGIKSDLVRDVGIKDASITTIYNGIDTNEYSMVGDQDELIKGGELFLNSWPVLGSVGNLRQEKGHRYLIQSLPKVLKEYPKLKLVIIGDGELKDNLVDLTQKLCVDRNVHFLGHRLDVPQLMKTFDILVQPSLTEGISIVILEAMASSRPVIATDVGGNSSLIVNGLTGLLIPSKDPDSISNAIIDLLENEDKRITMGKEGFERVKKRFSLQKTVSEYEKVYLSLIKKGNDSQGRN